MEDLLQGIANYGFPIMVSAYLLIRMEGKIEHLQKAIQELCRTLERMNRT